jgi:ectoine hydroxylase-related dioxygenase (phytanoyl-CoA dioxygenase family)
MITNAPAREKIPPPPTAMMAPVSPSPATPTLETFAMLTANLVSDELKQQFETEGYVILPGVIPPDLLAMLREECSYFLGYYDAQMDARGATSEGINHRGSRYFISNRYRLSTRMHQFIFSSLMADLTTSLLGPDVYLFNEQWVVKGAEKGMKFAWHQDSGYVKYGDKMTTHKPYLTCWCTLDDVSEANGTVYVLPHSRGGTKNTILDHEQEAVTHDLIGYKGSDPGDPVIAPAGSIVAFSSYLFHRSGPNQSKAMRRIYLPQYAGEPIQRTSGGLWGMAVPFVKDGQIVYNRADDTADKYGPHPRT